ncbi:MAG: hypothetical protein COW89_10520 [Nitrospinae bacterium CG22_combo_CG10-13_8_21_14_all_47_10]|nr:MAG: hypothetical protein COW89_10520 [Nitrospinae bacterium CG22_combo_CG10-13_8_21_14_all_47_10]
MEKTFWQSILPMGKDKISTAHGQERLYNFVEFWILQKHFVQTPSLLYLNNVESTDHKFELR